MLDQLSMSVRRLTRNAIPVANRRLSVPNVRFGDGSVESVTVAQGDMAMLRGVTVAAADVAACTCPEACERDHANE